MFRQVEFGFSQSQVFQVPLGQAILDPRLDLSEHPRDPVLAQPDPLWELACLLQPCDVLRRVLHEFGQLLLAD